MTALEYDPDERALLDAILADPDDDDLRLVYADWLEERGDERAEYLRTEVAYIQCDVDRKRDRKELHFALRRARKRVSREWVATIARTRIENCGAMQRHVRLNGMTEQGFDEYLALSDEYSFVIAIPHECPLLWERLSGEGEGRKCERCCARVFYCSTVAEARQHVASGKRVAIDTAELRWAREEDLESTYSPPRKGTARDVHPNEDVPALLSSDRRRRIEARNERIMSGE